MAKILIADDDPVMLSMLREYVTGLGHEVKTATDGLQAGIQAKSWRPDLLISDIQMPGFYGTTAAVSLQQDAETQRIPIIFISGVAPAAAEKLVASIRLQAKYPDRIRFVAKPIDFKQFDAHVFELLSRGPGAKA